MTIATGVPYSSATHIVNDQSELTKEMLFSFRSPDVIPAKAGIQRDRLSSDENELLLATPLDSVSSTE